MFQNKLSSLKHLNDQLNSDWNEKSTDIELSFDNPKK